jgi:hypothetical protein
MVTKKIERLTVDDKRDGYSLFSYTIPADGYYTFSVDGGLVPKKTCTIYYCEYQLELQSKKRIYSQENLNIASQAQDGNICVFNANAKDNKVSGIFNKDEVVELKLKVLKSDVNGQPHHQMSLTDNTLVSVKQVTPGYVNN